VVNIGNVTESKKKILFKYCGSVYSIYRSGYGSSTLTIYGPGPRRANNINRFQWTLARIPIKALHYITNKFLNLIFTVYYISFVFGKTTTDEIKTGSVLKLLDPDLYII